MWHPITEVVCELSGGVRMEKGRDFMSVRPLTSDLQAGLTLPSAIFVDRLASVETSISPLSSQDPQPAEPTLGFLCKAPLVWAHRLPIPQPVKETSQNLKPFPAFTATGGGRLQSHPPPPLPTGFLNLYG